MTDNQKPISDPTERLKRELKALPRMKAPWFLEAELQRRLREGTGQSRTTGFLARPIPAYALSALGVVAVGFLAYVFLVQQPAVEPMKTESPRQVDEVSPDQSVLQQAPASSQKLHADPAPAMIESPGRGPSSSSADAVIEAKIQPHQSSAAGQSDSELQFAAPGESGGQENLGLLPSQVLAPQNSGARVTGLLDSLASHHSSKDSLDSLRHRADSLKNLPHR